MAQKQGLVDGDGQAVSQRRERPTGGSRPVEERTKPKEFVKEVRSELRKVKWPTREEVLNYSLIVFILVTLLTASIALMDYLFGAGVLALFER